MAFRGIDSCLRCGKRLRASRLPFIGDCCAKRVTPEQLDAMRVYAAQVADPFHIPAPRPLSAQGRANNRNARAALLGADQICARHGNQIGRCPDCRFEAQPENAAALILRAVRAQPHQERRAERARILAARYSRAAPWTPPPRPARPARPARAARPRYRTKAAPAPKEPKAGATEQLELL